MNGSSKKRLMVTVDVEAQPRRAERDAVERLIWGRFPDGRAGISEMMVAAEKYDAKLTMFLDYCERDIHGDAIIEAGKQIHSRGHDLQLHAHPDFMDTEYWQSKGATRIANLNETTPEQAAILFDFLVAEHRKCTGEMPLAFRGGGYRFNADILDAMVARGVLLNSSFNPSRKTQPRTFDYSKQFKWSNGCIEVPITSVKKFRNLQRPHEFNFNSGAFSSADIMVDHTNNFHNEFGDDAIAVLVMHSWSLLHFDKDSGFFTHPAPENLTRFDEFLSKISKTHQIMSSKDVVELVEQNKVSMGPSIDIAIFKQPNAGNEAKPVMQLDIDAYINKSADDIAEDAKALWDDEDRDPDRSQAVQLFQLAYEKGDHATSAYRLGTAYYHGFGVRRDIAKAHEFFAVPQLDGTRFALYYRGLILKNSAFPHFSRSLAWEALSKAAALGVEAAAQELKSLPSPPEKECPICGSAADQFEAMQGRKCPDCGSLERQRAFAIAYERDISQVHDLSGKRGLLISPSASEKRFFESIDVGSIISVDVRPEAKTDIVADICDMPGIATSAYDFIFASYVFPCVRDLDAALREIARVLMPGGLLISVDHMVKNGETREATSREEITSWYGVDNFEQYGVGSFRKLGERGLIRQLSQNFDVVKIEESDPITGNDVTILTGVTTDEGSFEEAKICL